MIFSVSWVYYVASKNQPKKGKTTILKDFPKICLPILNSSQLLKQVTTLSLPSETSRVLHAIYHL